jgi:hypothetical protein
MNGLSLLFPYAVQLARVADYVPDEYERKQEADFVGKVEKAGKLQTRHDVRKQDGREYQRDCYG